MLILSWFIRSWRTRHASSRLNSQNNPAIMGQIARGPNELYGTARAELDGKRWAELDAAQLAELDATQRAELDATRRAELP